MQEFALPVRSKRPSLAVVAVRSPRDQIFDRALGAKMAAVRRSKGITAVHTAAWLGVCVQQLRKYEAGINRMTASIMFDLCQLYGVSADAMFALTGGVSGCDGVSAEAPAAGEIDAGAGAAATGEIPPLMTFSWKGQELFFDKLARQVGDDEKEVVLSAREADLFAALLAGKGEMVSRAQLLTAMYGDAGKDEQERRRHLTSLGVLMFALRTKIMDLGFEPALKTLWGAGYVLEVENVEPLVLERPQAA